MPEKPHVVLSGFADEAATHKTAVEQFAAFAALGLEYYSLRFIDVTGDGVVKNALDLTKSEVTSLRHVEAEFGMNVASLGSPIGKTRLIDEEDGTGAPYTPFKKYLKQDVAKAIDRAHAFETKLIRGFSFYPPRGADPREHLPQAVDQLGQIAEACHHSDLTFGLEVEANLVGRNGALVAELHRQVNHPAMVTVFDGGNLVSQGYTTLECYEQYLQMRPSLGWLHVKDYAGGGGGKAKHVDEEALKHFVPVDAGDSGYDLVFRDLKKMLPKLDRKLRRRGIPGVVVDLEPHLKGGGQLGGFSGPDGFGVALRSLCTVLDAVGVGYHLRDFDDVRAARGY